MKVGEKKVMYGLWDSKFNDFVMLPAPDGYCHAVFDDLGILQFCLNGADAEVVKIVVEPLIQGGENGSGSSSTGQ